MYEQTLVLIHLTLLLDIEAEKALDRKEGDLDRMEQLDLLRSARAAYLSFHKACSSHSSDTGRQTSS